MVGLHSSSGVLVHVLEERNVFNGQAKHAARPLMLLESLLATHAQQALRLHLVLSLFFTKQGCQRARSLKGYCEVLPFPTAHRLTRMRKMSGFVLKPARTVRKLATSRPLLLHYHSNKNYHTISATTYYVTLSKT
eukprot:6081493-Amphidinium_carterae.1